MPTTYLTVSHLTTKQIIYLFSKIAIHSDLIWNGTPCWIWTANRDKDGYGVFKYARKNRRAHKFTYSWLIEPLPEGRKLGEIDHLCRRTSCCNPLHLEFVSARINILRSNGAASRNAQKTHCLNGHPLSGSNLKVDSQGHRQCRTCTRALSQKSSYKEKKREYERTSPTLKISKAKWQAANREKINTQARQNYRARRLRAGLPTRPGAYID